MHTDLRPVDQDILKSAEHECVNWPWRRDTVCPCSTQQSQLMQTRERRAVVKYFVKKKKKKTCCRSKMFSSLAGNVRKGLIYTCQLNYILKFKWKKNPLVRKIMVFPSKTWVGTIPFALSAFVFLLNEVECPLWIKVEKRVWKLR